MRSSSGTRLYWFVPYFLTFREWHVKELPISTSFNQIAKILMPKWKNL